MGFWPTDAVDCWLIPNTKLSVINSLSLLLSSWGRAAGRDDLAEIGFTWRFLFSSCFHENRFTWRFLFPICFDENGFTWRFLFWQCILMRMNVLIFWRFVLIPMDFLYAWLIPFRRWHEDKKGAWLILAEHFDKLRDLDLRSLILDFGFLRSQSLSRR